MSQCFFHERIRTAHTCSSDRAFMGATHAMSAIFVFLLVLVITPDGLRWALGSASIWIAILSLMTIAGACSLPDLDNTSSTSRNSLGPLGVGLSTIFRVSSRAIQTIVRTKRDDPTPNPHRGFWHTIPASAILGFLVFLGASMEGTIDMPWGEVTHGGIFAFVITGLLVHLSLSGLAKDFMKKVKKNSIIGELATFIVSFLLTSLVYFNLPDDTGFWWLGVTVFVGCVIHIMGDAFTTAGVPIFFPLTAFTKGKFWWNTRLTSMKAGGETENMIFSVMTVATIILAVIAIFRW